MKALLLFVIAFGAFLLVRFVMKRVDEIRQDAQDSQPENTDLSQQAERMATCAECGLRLPESEAIPLNASMDSSNNHNSAEPIVFCSQAHKQSYLAKHPQD